MNFIFVADSFLEDGYAGGAEICSYELINRLRSIGHNVVQVYSFFVSPQFIREAKDNVFIISNFLQLSEDSKEELSKVKFILYEHDHKYLSTRDPSVFENHLASSENIINFDFYKNAYKVVTQSTRHKNIIEKNLKLDNIVVGYNFWSQEQINNLRENCNNEKIYDSVITEHIFRQKNTKGSIDYCKVNNINYFLIPFGLNHKDFCRHLSLGKNLVFFPLVNETLSRVSIEAHCLNTELITNNNISYLDEDWSKLRGTELIDFIENAPNETIKIFES